MTAAKDPFNLAGARVRTKKGNVVNLEFRPPFSWDTWDGDFDAPVSPPLDLDWSEVPTKWQRAFQEHLRDAFEDDEGALVPLVISTLRNAPMSATWEGSRDLARIERREHERRLSAATTAADAKAQETADKAALVRKRANDYATERRATELAAARRSKNPPATPKRLTELLAAQPVRIPFVVEPIMKQDSTVILSGPPKGGKSSVIGNFVRACADGGLFLGRFQVTPPRGNICLVDFEMGEEQAVEWLREQEVENTDRVYIEDAVGAVGAWDLRDPVNMDAAVEKMTENGVEILILDPLAPLLAVLDVDEYHPSGANILYALDELKRRAGLGNVIVSHHSGNGRGGRARGTSAIRGWPSVLWDVMLQSEEEHSKPREFKAFGRGIDLAPGLLVMDEDKRLTFETKSDSKAAAQSSYKSAMTEALRSWALGQIDANPGVNANQLETLRKSTKPMADIGGKEVRLSRDGLRQILTDLELFRWVSRSVGASNALGYEVVPVENRGVWLHS